MSCDPGAHTQAVQPGIGGKRDGMRRSAPPASEIRAELKALADEFFQAVSFERGERPAYGKIHDLFIDDGKLIRCSSEVTEITSAQEFIASRQHMFASGELTPFEEVDS